MNLKTISGFRNTREAARHGGAIRFRATGFQVEVPRMETMPVRAPAPAAVAAL